ncbi:unnamed protein product [Calicophoron daubneyi]|uniref:Uncharacterized protein n=1 Tax=Calicophoron daubneyi TaxID=300641 RepID=A0AAV2T8R3_CALDB
MEREVSEDTELSSDATIHMGLPPKRKIRRKVLSEEEVHPVDKPTVLRPQHVQYDIPRPHSSTLRIDSPQKNAAPPLGSLSSTPSSRNLNAAAKPNQRPSSPVTPATAVHLSPSHSKLPTSAPVSLEHLHEVQLHILREQKKMAALIAHIDSRCQSLQQSVDSLSAKIQTAGDSQSPSAGIPAYNMEQVINLNSNLQHLDFYKHVVS